MERPELVDLLKLLLQRHQRVRITTVKHSCQSILSFVDFYVTHNALVRVERRLRSGTRI